MEQTNLFGYLYPDYEITKPIRIIEFFAGDGTFSMALRDLECDYETWKICEWDVNAIASNKAIHRENDLTDYSEVYTKEQLAVLLYELGISNDGKSAMDLDSIRRKNEQWIRTTYNNIKATRNLVDITKVEASDLEIVDTDKYCYLLTYSFPCQDLSKAGKQRGMAKDSGTRSSLLWQFERIMIELSEMGIQPDILIMENVPDVVATKNIKHFNEWYSKLEQLGYQSYYKNLNAKDFEIPQNRNRTFMISFYGEYNYMFPSKLPLKARLKDVLEDQVDEKYYLSDKQLDYFIRHSKECEEKGSGFRFKPSDGSGIARTCTTHPSGLRMDDNFVKVVGNTNPSGKGMNGNVSVGGLAPALTTNKGEGPKIIEIVAKRIGNIYGEDKGTGFAGNVWDCEWLSPTITTFQGGNRQPMIVEPNSKLLEPSIYQHPRGANKGGNKAVCPTITSNSFQENNHLIEPSGLYTNCSDGFERGCLEGMSRCIKAENHDAGVSDGLRIRKLTPLECWRLMGYTDDDFRKAASVNSNSQLYKQAGNGIVKQVAMAIFRQMLPQKKAK